MVDAIAERIQLLGSVSIAMAHDVAETTLIPRPPKGREGVPVQISRLLHAHEIVLKKLPPSLGVRLTPVTMAQRPDRQRRDSP